MTDMGLSRHVDGIFYSAALGVRKPDPGFFAKAAALAGFLPENIVFVDDTQDNVIAAANSGWNAFHWDATQRLSEIVMPFLLTA